MEYVQHKNTKAEEAAKSTSPSSATTTSQTLTHTIAFTTQPKSIAFTTNKNRTPHRGPRTSDDAKTGPPLTMNPNFTSVHTNHAYGGNNHHHRNLCGPPGNHHTTPRHFLTI
jgi:hypothetical protein